MEFPYRLKEVSEMPVTFKRDASGNLVAYRDGKKIGSAGGMGDANPKGKPSRKRKTTKKK